MYGLGGLKGMGQKSKVKDHEDEKLEKWVWMLFRRNENGKRISKQS